MFGTRLPDPHRNPTMTARSASTCWRASASARSPAFPPTARRRTSRSAGCLRPDRNPTGCLLSLVRPASHGLEGTHLLNRSVSPMKGSFFHSEIWLPRPIAEIFPFFGNARNLEIITPPWLQFKILTEGPIEMREGTLIDYRIRLRGIPLRWQTRIDVWDPPRRFIDIQVRGPYQRWHHEHIFEPKDYGTLCSDRVDYAVPGGTLVDRLFVGRDLERIFEFRREKLLELFERNVRT
jgi:ligand-binding SRPBCC domain-containing protein